MHEVTKVGYVTLHMFESIEEYNFSSYQNK